MAKKLIGEKFGQLTVIQRDCVRQKVFWICKCDCSQFTSVSTSHLVLSRVKSCGCYRVKCGEDKGMDITGNTYGTLTAIRLSHRTRKHSFWVCKCTCGEETIAQLNNLRTGNTTACPAAIHRIGNGLEDISGHTFNRLTAISLNRDVVWKGSRTFWNCSCVCGNLCVVESGNLKSGHTNSCGCLLQELITTHGYAKKATKRIYNIRRGMLDRCYNPKNKGYKHYGLRNIIVCLEWRENIGSFIEWALANGYENNLTLERDNVNGNYEPSNCKWIPLKEQPYNTTKSVGVERVRKIRSELSLGAKPKDVAAKYGFKYQTIIAIKNFKCYADVI